MTTRTIIQSLGLFVALLVAAGPEAWAQGEVIAFDEFTVEISPRVPVIAQSIRVTVTASEPTIQSGTLFYRVTGSNTYTSITAMPTGGTVFTAEIPAEAMTVRGLDLYGEFVDEGELSTFPEENPAENPFRLRIFLGSVRAELDLAPRQYRMVSVPVDIGVSSIREVLQDDLGVQDSSRWRAARWQPESRRYDGSLGQAISAGDGFWVIAANGNAFDVDVATSTEPDSMNTIMLEPGQNQIGNPFAFRVAWADVVADGPVSPPVGFDGVEYLFDQAVLEPWVGYFVTNTSGRRVTLTVPPREAGAFRPPASSASLVYGVQLVAHSGDYRDTQTLVGFSDEASEGRDALDRSEPPPVGDGLGVSVLEGEERWARSIRPVPADGARWGIEVTASDELLAAPRRVALSIAEEGSRLPGFGLWVIDRDLGTALAVTDGTFEVTLSRDAPARRLWLIAGTEAFARAESEGAPLEPVAFALDAGFPNPFAAHTTLHYRLATRGRATLEVFDVLGRRVRVLADADHDAGAHTAVWDGRDGSGRLAASGVYLVRLRAADASSTRRVSILR